MGAQDADGVLEVLLEKGDGLVEPARFPIGASEVAARGESDRVSRSQGTGAVFEVLLEQGNGLVESAGCLVGAASVLREVKVSGRSGPRMRMKSVRFCSKRGIASSSLPVSR